MFTEVVFSQEQDTTELHIFVDDINIVGTRAPISNSDKHGNITINIRSSQNLPRFGGSLNFMRLLQYTPGVAASAEGSGLVVRGGDYGQNRMLLNGAPIYSPPHLFEFMPIINSSYTDKLTLIKSNIPTEYGFASSSIVDISTLSQIPQRTTIDGEFGLIGSSIVVQLPLGKKVALFASARTSYTSWLLDLLYIKDGGVLYEFYDSEVGLVADLGKVGVLNINTHFNHDNGVLSIDRYGVGGDFMWWNGVGSATLNTFLADNLVMENTLYTSIYNNNMNMYLLKDGVSIGAGVQDWGLHNISTFTGKRSKISWGLDYSFRRITPQHIYSDHISNPLRNIHNTHEMALFASAEWDIASVVNVYSGIRMSLYHNGKTWFYPEPRVMFTLPIGSTTSLWVNYNMMVQYLQLVPQSNASLATDFYIGAAPDYEPQRSHNFSAGYKQHTEDGTFSWSMETFYRRMYGVIEFNKLLSHLLAINHNYNKYLHSGNGLAYGVETSFGYTGKKFSTRANYTLGRSMRRIRGFNNGEVFPANSDRLHTLSVISTYEPSPKWILSATFIYASGAPYTAPVSMYISGGTLMKEYSSYNGVRLPDLHHLDLSVSYRIPSKRLRENILNISVFNAYAHKNPLMISWEITPNATNPDILKIKKRVHSLYTIIPSVSWSFKF